MVVGRNYTGDFALAAVLRVPCHLHISFLIMMTLILSPSLATLIHSSNLPSCLHLHLTLPMSFGCPAATASGFAEVAACTKM